MEKDLFKKIMNELIKLKEDEDKLNSAFKVFCPDFNYMCFSRYESLVVDCLKEMMKDKEDWIGYFLYERDCKFTKKQIIKSKDGKNIPFRNMDDLYDLMKK